MTLENGILNRKSGFRNPRNFCLWNPESWAFESGIQLKESGIPLTIGIQNLSSTDKDWNPVPGIRNPRSGIQNPRLSWILLVRRFEERMSSKDCATVWRQKKSNVVTSTSLRRIWPFLDPRYVMTPLSFLMCKKNNSLEKKGQKRTTTQQNIDFSDHVLLLQCHSGLWGIRGFQNIIIRAKDKPIG